MNLKQAIKNTRGFTLIELLVTITIIGIMATGATTVYQSAQQKARDSVRVSDLGVLKMAIEQYYSDYDEYPTTANTADFKNKLEKYVDRWPEDSKGSGGNGYNYVYCVADKNNIGAQAYALSARMENDGSAKANSLSVIDSSLADNEDAKRTYVDGPDPVLIGAASTDDNNAQCDNAPGGNYDTVEGGMIANS